MSNCILEISKKAFLNNVNSIKKYVGDNIFIMPVVKANAYGTYINKNIELMSLFGIVAVSNVDEAIELRIKGFNNDIFVLNQPLINDIDKIVQYDIIVGVCSLDFLKVADKKNKRMRVHIELETGMGRTGVLNNELVSFLEGLKLFSNIIVEGVYTHLASADVDFKFTDKQLKKFNDQLLLVKHYFPDIKYIHSSASSGILNADLVGNCNLVRPGMILYGYQSCKSCYDKIKLEPVAKLKSKISYLKKISVGDSVSYGRSYVADVERVVATVACGYADGVRRELSNKGYVVIKGVRCKIIGKVCMDSFMVDVSEVKDVSINDDVYIFDNNLVTLDEIALICETINYEILSCIGERVERKFTD